MYVVAARTSVRQVRSFHDSKTPSSLHFTFCVGTMRTGGKDNQTLLGKLGGVASKPMSIKHALAEYSLAAMSNRICALEEALQIEVSEEHPLLSPELLAIKQGVNISFYDSDESYVRQIGTKAGTLSISEESGMRFLGASAAEVCVCCASPSLSAHQHTSVGIASIRCDEI